jgi:hypothetical protein
LPTWFTAIACSHPAAPIATPLARANRNEGCPGKMLLTASRVPSTLEMVGEASECW